MTPNPHDKKGCGKMIFYKWKNPTTNLYSDMPSHKCGEDGMVLCKECIRKQEELVK